jgi:hypothetical protein
VITKLSGPISNVAKLRGSATAAAGTAYNQQRSKTALHSLAAHSEER